MTIKINPTVLTFATKVLSAKVVAVNVTLPSIAVQVVTDSTIKLEDVLQNVTLDNVKDFAVDDVLFFDKSGNYYGKEYDVTKAKPTNVSKPGKSSGCKESIARNEF